jgi:hypothetical protein
MMKLPFTLLLLISFASFSAQTSWDADMVSGATKNVWSGINSYTASDDSFWEVGQEITLGNPSGQGQFNFISVGSGVMTPVTQATPGYAGTSAIIKKIVVSGSKRAGRYLWLKTEGLFPMNIRLEKCIELGEIETDGYSSDQALEELKKAKDKLDLGLITQEEFDALKAELIKYID